MQASLLSFVPRPPLAFGYSQDIANGFLPLMPMPPIEMYPNAEKMAASTHVNMYKMPVKGADFDWYFIDNPAALSGVGVLAIVEREGQYHIPLLEVARPPLGGATVLELPCGGWGDEAEHPTETVEGAARRELHEETGYTAEAITPMTDTFFTMTAGMSTELRRYFLAYGTGEESREHWDVGEKATIRDIVYVPLNTFMDDEAFYQWVDEQNKISNRVVAADILSARSLLESRLHKLHSVHYVA